MESSCLPPSNMQACSGDAQRWDGIFTSCTTQRVHEQTWQNRTILSSSAGEHSTAIVGNPLPQRRPWRIASPPAHKAVSVSAHCLLHTACTKQTVLAAELSEQHHLPTCTQPWARSYMFEVALCDGGIKGGASSHASVQICHEFLVQGEDVLDVWEQCLDDLLWEAVVILTLLSSFLQQVLQYRTKQNSFLCTHPV